MMRLRLYCAGRGVSTVVTLSMEQHRLRHYMVSSCGRSWGRSIAKFYRCKKWQEDEDADSCLSDDELMTLCLKWQVLLASSIAFCGCVASRGCLTTPEVLGQESSLAPAAEQQARDPTIAAAGQT